MKKSLFFLLSLFVVSIASAEEKEISLSLGAGYVNQVFYKLGTDSITTISASDWDVMFGRTSTRDYYVRVNDATTKVYQVFNTYSSRITTEQWDSITLNNAVDSKLLYNSDTIWNQGAFMQAKDPSSSPYYFSWGYYNMSDHHLYGCVIFVLKYVVGSTTIYRKLLIDDYYAGFTIKYATWNAETSSWGETTTTTISNTTGDGKSYNYYSFATNSVVASIPDDDDWDMVFTKYITPIPAGTDTVMYSVTGVLQKTGVTAVKSSDGSVPSSSEYSSTINTIGYDWKTYDPTAAKYTVGSNSYFIKSTDGITYKLWFTSFSNTTGDVSFKYTTDLSTSSVVSQTTSSDLSFSYSVSQKALLVANVSSAFTVKIYSLSGQTVFSEDSSGSEVSLAGLKSGIYIVQLKSGSAVQQGKIVVP